MIKYAQIINAETGTVNVGIGENTNFYKDIGMQEMEVEYGQDGKWYLMGRAPKKIKSVKNIEKIKQLENKLNNSNNLVMEIIETLIIDNISNLVNENNKDLLIFLKERADLRSEIRKLKEEI